MPQAQAFLTQLGNDTYETANEAPHAYDMTDSQSTLLLQKQKKMQDVQSELLRKKREFEQRMRKCNEKEKELAEKQQKIRESVVHFKKFVKENDVKRARAMKKERDEINACKQKEQEIITLRQELQHQSEKKEQITHTLNKLLVYDAYLEKLIEYSEDFHEVNDILRRHATLQASNSDLGASVEEGLKAAEERRTELNDYMKDAEKKMLLITSKIAQYQQLSDQLRLENEKLEQAQLYKEGQVMEKKREQGEAKMAIHNIFSRCVSIGMSKPKENEMKKVLEFIQQRMIDLGDICRMKDHPEVREYTKSHKMG